MIVKAIKTPLIKVDDDLKTVVANAIKDLPESSVLVITSKIISYSQGRLVKPTIDNPVDPKAVRAEKHALVRREADYYLDPKSSKYDVMLTIKNDTLAINAGLDESNAAGKYVLWPEKLQQTVNQLWQWLRDHYQVEQLGVLVSDSKTIPLRWGVVGTAIAHCGFKALHDYRGKKDLFGREIKMSQINVAEAIAVAAALEMGEVKERTPLCLVKDIKKVEFQDRPPTQQELIDLTIALEDDLYAPVLMAADWQQGENQQK